MPSRARPPRIARFLLTLLLPEEYRDAFLGDVDEEFARRAENPQSAGGARTWYWGQLIHMDMWRLRGEARTERAHKTVGREGMMRDTIMIELRQALRVFKRNPGFVAAVMLTLSIGIGGTTAIFSLANALLLRPVAGVDEPSGLAAINTSEYGGAFGVSAYMDYLDFAERNRSFESLAAFKPRLTDTSVGGPPEPVYANLVTSSYFEVLGVAPLLGRFFGPEVDRGPNEHPVAVLTEGLWQRWFAGDPEAVGRTIVLNGLQYTVVGVTPEGFRGTVLIEPPELFVPMTMQPHLMPSSGLLLDRRGWGGIYILGRLAPGTTLETAGHEVQAIGSQIAEENPRQAGERRYAVTDFRAATLPGTLRGSVLQMSALLFAIVGTLWLVVCLNVANLFFARSLKRRDELAVRRALGAGRGRIISALILEFMSIAVIAGVAGMFLARVMASTVASFPFPILWDISLDWRTAAFAGVLAASSGLLCALIPSFAMSGTTPKAVVASTRATGSRSQRWPSKVLIVSQVTLSVILLFGTGVFVKTFVNLTSADPGFDESNLLTAQFNPGLQGYETAQIVDYYERLVERSLGIPGVEEVALADALPAVGILGRDGWHIENATDPEESSSFFSSLVSAGYFETLAIPIVEGRPFTRDDTPSQPPVLIVNETGARLIESRVRRDAIGARMSVNGPDGPFFEVVGVVGDSRTGREQAAEPLVYASHDQLLPLGMGGERMVVMLKTSVPPASVAGDFHRIATEVDPRVAAGSMVTMERFLDDLLAADRIIVIVLGISSGLALLLVALGVYGLFAYVVTQRTREFGIRVALGAATASLKGIVIREALTLAAVGLVLGSAGALFVARYATSFLVGVSASDPGSLVLGIGTVVGVTIAAAYVPARRAMAADPVESMRVE